MSILRVLENNPKVYIFECPQCGLLTEVETKELNCKIFRHGGTTTFAPIHPHAPKGKHVSMQPNYTSPEWPPRAGQIYGCGQPFQVVNNGKDLIARKCGWI